LVEEGNGRLRLSLAPEDDCDLATGVDRLGARRIDTERGDVTWARLVDPDGNEFRMSLEP
jgi:hypothetical protein